MAAQIQLQDDATVSLDRLQRCADETEEIALRLIHDNDAPDELLFELEYKRSYIKALTPIFYGQLPPRQNRAVLEGEFYPREFGVGFIKMWSMGIALLAAVPITSSFCTLVTYAVRTSGDRQLEAMDRLPRGRVQLRVHA